MNQETMWVLLMKKIRYKKILRKYAFKGKFPLCVHQIDTCTFDRNVFHELFYFLLISNTFILYIYSRNKKCKEKMTCALLDSL